jgi:hypothetical protein
MNDLTPAPRRSLWKAGSVLLAIYVAGVLTGIGGGLLFVKRQVREALQGQTSARAPIDFLLAEFEADLAKKASLTPDERAALHERMQALATRFKSSRLRLAGEMREAIRTEVDTVAARVAPARRELVRELFRRRLERLGVEPRPAITPRPTENL